MDAAASNRRYASSEPTWTGEPNRFLVEEVEGLAPSRALDLAGGDGRTAVRSARQGWWGTADFSQVGLDKDGPVADCAGAARDVVRADATGPIETTDLAVVLYLDAPEDQRRRAYRVAVAIGRGRMPLIAGRGSTNLAAGVDAGQGPPTPFTATDVVTDLDGSGLTVRRAIDALVRAERLA